MDCDTNLISYFIGWNGWDAVNGIALVVLVVITAYYARQTHLIQEAMRLPNIEIRDISLLIEYKPNVKRVCKVECAFDNKNMAKGVIDKIRLVTRFEGEKNPKPFLPFQVDLSDKRPYTPNEPIVIDGNSTCKVTFNFGGRLNHDMWTKIKEQESSLEWRLVYYDVVLGNERDIEIKKKSQNILL